AAVLVRNDVSVNFDWGTGSPGPGVPADNFSARWSRGLHFPAGNYRFYVRVDDGVRLWVDGNLVIDQWHDSAPTTYTADVNLTDGLHDLKMEYYERGGGALAQLTWERLDNYPDWKAEYYNNPNLSGAPVLVRNDVSVNFDWGTGSPGPGVPADNFSARWSHSISFPAGTYRFHVRVDDAVRLWIDDNLDH
ncbi:MAG: beta-glucosidase, partial [Anaerolineae bacterium]|nr:beta-glucosidase [Anaerolineae bacterium]